jgi:hypothetical protein
MSTVGLRPFFAGFGSSGAIRPLLVRQIERVPFGFLLDFGHPAAIRWGPHPKLESRLKPIHNPFSNGHLAVMT